MATVLSKSISRTCPIKVHTLRALTASVLSVYTPELHRERTIRHCNVTEKPSLQLTGGWFKTNHIQPFLSIPKPNVSGSFIRQFCSSSNLETDLEGIKEHINVRLNKKYMKDDIREKHLDLLAAVLKLRLGQLESEMMTVVAERLPADAVYWLASQIIELQDKVGDEASTVATPLFKLATEMGDLNAKYSYAQLLCRGTGGLPLDPQTASTLFMDLAKAGHPYAQHSLAGMYYSGFGTDQNYETALSLFQISAHNKVAASYNMLGKMHYSGEGTKQNFRKAVQYFIQGTEAGDMQSCMSLAHCYSHGKGVLVNHEQAFFYHRQAAEMGHIPAIYNLGTHYFAGKGVGPDMKLAADYFQQASDAGFHLATINLGNMYVHGFGVEKDLSKAKALYEKAAPHNTQAKLLLEELANPKPES